MPKMLVQERLNANRNWDEFSCADIFKQVRKFGEHFLWLRALIFLIMFGIEQCCISPLLAPLFRFATSHSLDGVVLLVRWWHRFSSIFFTSLIVYVFLVVGMGLLTFSSSSSSGHTSLSTTGPSSITLLWNKLNKLTIMETKLSLWYHQESFCEMDYSQHFH